MESIKFEKYIIVGTGPSVKSLTPQDYESIPDDVIIVSVNSSILFLPQVDIWFTLDPSSRNVKYNNIARQRQIPTVVAVGNDNRVKRLDATYLLKRKEATHGNYVRHFRPRSPEEWFKKWKCLRGFSEITNTIHTGNSLYGALNLVYFDKPKRVALLGLDGSNKLSYGGNHAPNNLSHLPMLFDSAVDQLKNANIDIMNGSEDSIVTCFKRVSPRYALDWISVKDP